MRMRCEQCLGVQEVNAFIFKKRREAGLPYACALNCGADLHEHGESVEKGRGTDSQKRSRKQEKRLAKDLGGRVQPASGAGLAKGDVRSDMVRAECKLTRAKSFSLKLAELEKIEREAAGAELPILQLDFQGVHPHKQYVVMPYWVFQSLMED